jgi:hypothetical protein
MSLALLLMVAGAILASGGPGRQVLYADTDSLPDRPVGNKRQAVEAWRARR